MTFEKNKGESSKQINAEEGTIFVPENISNIIKKMPCISNSSIESSELDLRLPSYENEMIKVDAFKRIEKLKEEKLKCKEREKGLVMEQEFIEPRGNAEGDGRAQMSIDLSEKRNWMSSVQLWSTPVEYEDSFHPWNQESFLSLKSKNNHKEGPTGLFKNSGGAFLPFKKPSAEEEEEEEVLVKESRGLVIRQRKQRRCWSPELHNLFVDALNHLGGAEVATPKRIREHMKIEGLTNDEVKSHLQKYRMHLRRLASTSSTVVSELQLFRQTDDQMASNSGSSQDHGF